MSDRKICIFEDEKYGNLYPIALTHPVFELKCGHTFLYEKIIRNFNNAKAVYFVREYLVSLVKKKIGNVSVTEGNGVTINDSNSLKGNDVLFINGRWVFMNYDLQLDGDEEIGIDKDGTIIYARLNRNIVEGFTGTDISQFLKNSKDKIKNIKTINVAVVNYLWDLVKFNPEAIKDDFKHLKETGIKGKFAKSSEVFGDNNLVFVAKTAQVHPQVVLDTTLGPVIIDEGAIVYPFTRIEGPSCIGRNTFIVGAKIREGSAIGETCRIGGEVEESIVHGFSNKYHEGFLGHAYLGEWVNLGAST
ncbi:MAG: putative sugar nucleotidyl transferase, partial [Candidatus Firestonebacteria bacterium]